MKTNKLALFLMIALVSCKVNVGTNESEQFKVVQLSGNIDFEDLKTYIMNPSCIRCHSWAENESSVQQRITAGNPETSLLYQKIKNGSMPPSGALSAKQIELVERYIKTAKAAPTIAINSTFKSLQFHLIGKSCFSCHNDNSGLISFQGYDNVKRHANEIIDILDIGEMEGNPMPPYDSNGGRQAPVPSQEIIEAFRTWIAEGTQNN